MKKLSKRNLVRIISFLSAAAIALALFVGSAVIKATEYVRKTEAMYEQSLVSAAEHLSDMDTVLLKGLYSESRADQCSMCADVWMNAYAAKNAIGALPIADIDMNECYRYLSKCAEYARACEKKIAAGETLGAAEHESFLQLRAGIASLADSFTKLQKIYLTTNEKIAGGIDFSFAAPKTIATSSATSESLKSVNKNLSTAPKLIYDGPYSDAVNDKEPAMLAGEKPIALKDATAIAEQYLAGIPGALRYAGKKSANIEAFTFQKGDAYLEISVRGGKIVCFNREMNTKASAYSIAKLLENAARYLKKAGYENMKCNYYEKSGNILIANFHFVQSGVNCYTDLIKLKLDGESGTVCGFDATGFLTNHQPRSFDFRYSAAQLRARLSPYVTEKAVNKALIPTPAEKEALCYEYRCLTDRGEELLIYINAATAAQADILILQISQNGVLTK